MDNLPCATRFEMMESKEVQYEHGYKMGFVNGKEVRNFICTGVCDFVHAFVLTDYIKVTE